MNTVPKKFLSSRVAVASSRNFSVHNVLTSPVVMAYDIGPAFYQMRRIMDDLAMHTFLRRDNYEVLQNLERFMDYSSSILDV